MTFTINNQLTSQVQRLVRDGRPTLAYEGLYQIYGGRNVARQYPQARTDTFQHQLVSNILCPPSYQAMPSPTKHVVVGSATMQPPLQVPPQQYVNVPVPVSMVEPSSGQRMLLTNRVQASGVAWPQTGRQMALVPSWPQQAPAHSLIVDSTPLFNVEEIYPKHHLNLPRNDLKKESPAHHLAYVWRGSPWQHLTHSPLSPSLSLSQQGQLISRASSREEGAPATVAGEEARQGEFAAASAALSACRPCVATVPRPSQLQLRRRWWWQRRLRCRHRRWWRTRCQLWRLLGRQ